MYQALVRHFDENGPPDYVSGAALAGIKLKEPAKGPPPVVGDSEPVRDDQIQDVDELVRFLASIPGGSLER